MQTLSPLAQSAKLKLGVTDPELLGSFDNLPTDDYTSARHTATCSW